MSEEHDLTELEEALNQLGSGRRSRRKRQARRPGQERERPTEPSANSNGGEDGRAN